MTTINTNVEVGKVLSYIKTEVIEAPVEVDVDTLLSEVKYAIDNIISEKYDSYTIRRKYENDDNILKISASIDVYGYFIEADIYVDIISDNSRIKRTKYFKFLYKED